MAIGCVSKCNARPLPRQILGFGPGDGRPAAGNAIAVEPGSPECFIVGLSAEAHLRELATPLRGTIREDRGVAHLERDDCSLSWRREGSTLRVVASPSLSSYPGGAETVGAFAYYSLALEHDDPEVERAGSWVVSGAAVKDLRSATIRALSGVGLSVAEPLQLLEMDMFEGDDQSGHVIWRVWIAYPQDRVPSARVYLCKYEDVFDTKAEIEMFSRIVLDAEGPAIAPVNLRPAFGSQFMPEAVRTGSAK